MDLNLPIYNIAGEQALRVHKASVKASKVVSEALSLIPSVDSSSLEKSVNSMLASGTIKSLEEAYELGSVSNPNPYQEESEASLDKSGYTVVNKNTVFKLASGNYVEAIRMLYMAGVSIDDIRKKLSNVSEGDVLVYKCKSSCSKVAYSKYKELLHNTTTRFYKEYVTTLDDGNTYVVTDSLTSGTDYDCVYVIYIGQNDNDTAYLKCDEPSFPLSGTLSITIDGVDYSLDVNASSSFDLLNDLSSLDLTLTYQNGLIFSSDTSFSFKKTDLSEALNIGNALSSLRESMNCGFSGGSFIDGDKPYDVQVDVPKVSSSNTRKIYNAMINNGISKTIADKYLYNDSLYDGVQDEVTSLQEEIKISVPNSTSFTTKFKPFYNDVNVRVLETNKDVIDKVFELSDDDLEYLLRYRTDITNIDPYITSQDAAINMYESSESNSNGGSYFSDSESKIDAWKQNTANARTIFSYIFAYNKLDVNFAITEKLLEKETTKDNLETFLGVVEIVLTDSYDYSTTTTNTDECLGMEYVLTTNMATTLSLSSGLSFLGNSTAKIDTSYLDEFNADVLIIQKYMDSAFSMFSGIQSKIASIIRMLNSSLSVFNGSIGGGLGVDNIIQCSISVDLGLVIPLYLPNLNLALVAIIELLEALIDALVALENAILCPIQNLLDKYINGSITLPCKITYSVPVIADIGIYLSQYSNALAGLKALCKATKNNANWLSYKASMLPGSVSLMVTNSTDCSEG